MAVINGHDYGETLTGTADDDEIYGLGGNDDIRGGGGDDQMYGGDGNDSFVISEGADDHFGDDGIDTFTAGGNWQPSPDPYLGGYVINLTSGAMSGGWLNGDTLTGIENIIGGHHDDLLTGDLLDNMLNGADGDDRLWGEGGQDRLFGGRGNDILRGGDGDDLLDDDDFSEGDRLYGDGGNDELRGRAHADLRMYGGSGDDILTITGDLAVTLGGRIFGGGGNDILTGSLNQDYMNGGAGNDILRGLFTDGDTYIGGGGDDVIEDMGDNVVVRAGAGDDYVERPGVNSTLDGGTGYDRLVITGNGFPHSFDIDFARGEIVYVTISFVDGKLVRTPTGEITTFRNFEEVNGRFAVNGTKRDDTFDGDDRAVAYLGKKGSDTVDYATSAEAVTADLAATGSGGDAEGDTYVAVENLFGSLLADLLFGDDRNNTLQGREGADVLDGRGGAGDTASYAESDAFVVVSLGDGTGTGGHATGDTLIDIENLTGSAYADFLIGDDGGNVLSGLAGDDFLRGEAGRDTLRGGADDDMLMGGRQGDILEGGSGRDTASYRFSNSGVQVSLASGAASGGEASGDTLVSIENLEGSKHDDFLVGNGIGNVLSGNKGDDTLIGGAGPDRLEGGAGSDTASYADSGAGVFVNLQKDLAKRGDARGDVLVSIENLDGSRYDDTLIGDKRDNSLSGDAGEDFLRGGAGIDVLTVGGGADIFAFRYGDTTPGAPDRITDFEEVIDRIDLSALDLAGMTDVTITGLGSGNALVSAEGAGGRVDIILEAVTIGWLDPSNFIF